MKKFKSIGVVMTTFTLLLLLVSCPGKKDAEQKVVENEAPKTLVELTKVSLHSVTTSSEDLSGEFEMRIALKIVNGSDSDISVDESNFKLVNAQGGDLGDLRVTPTTIRSGDSYGSLVFIYATSLQLENYTVLYHPDAAKHDESISVPFTSRNIEYVGMGKKTTKNNVSIVINSVKSAKSVGRNTPKKEIFLILDVTIENKSGDILSVYASRFGLADEKDRQYEGSAHMGDWTGGGIRLGDGKKVRGEVVIDTVESSKYTFLFNSGTREEPVEIVIYSSSITQ